MRVKRLLPCLASLTMAQASPPEATLGDIEARLFYKETGRLSDDLLSRRKPFGFHNTIIGEGDAEEAADDLLIVVTIDSGKWGKPEENQKFIERPVEIVARGKDGKVLGRRVFPSVLTSSGGTERKALWLNDVTCAGDVTITATFAGQRKNATLGMGCGE